MEGRSLDLIEIDAASHRGIDEIRELRDGIKFAPIKSRYKVFIIDESHQLTKEAANALLKTLEEPPSHAIFILATTEIHKMIPTIISRCQRFDFRKLTLPEIIKKLQLICDKERVNVEKPALELIALNSGGAFRDAESLLDQALTFSGSLGKEGKIRAEDIKDLLGLVEINVVQSFTEFLYQKKAPEAIKFLKEISERGSDLQEFARTLINYLRQILIFKIVGRQTENPIITGLTKEEFQKLETQATVFQEAEIRHVLDLFLEAEGKMKYSPIQQLPLELAIIESCGIA
jgi:DNA polymerase-3 subunit gamma/tau